MAYHETFWLAVSAATPLIALASVVVITDTGNVWLDARAYKPSGATKRIYFSIISLAIINLLAQTFALIAALDCLLRGKDEVPGTTEIGLLAEGMAYMLIIAVFNIAMRYSLRRDEHRPHKEVGRGKHGR